MRLLHAIHGTMSTYTIWAYAMGGNGRPLGQEHVLAHAYLIERGTPPPLDSYPENRAYWRPFYQSVSRPDREFVLTPLCGRINTRSRYPRFSTLSANNTWTRHCPDCERMAPNTGYYNALVRDDPWMQLRDRNEVRWYMQPDPVTGA